MSPAVIILCRRPGFRRGGIAHPARAEYPAGHFSFAELEAFAAEPMLSVLPLSLGAMLDSRGVVDAGGPEGAADANATSELWILALADAGGAVAATATQAITGAATGRARWPSRSARGASR